MTAVTVPGARRPRSLLGLAFSAAARSPKLRRRAAALSAAVREHVITVTALACADWAAFGHSSFTGLITLAGCLLVLDFKLQSG